MKGLVAYGNGRIELANDIPAPELDDYTAIVKTFACGICNGTDLKLKAGHLNGFSTYPAVLGHETLGEVVRVGAKVSKFKVGDHVIRSGLSDSEKYYSLWGGYAEYTKVSDYEAMIKDGLPANIGEISQQVISKDIDPVDGVMVITFKEVYSALKRLGLGEGDSAAVSGCGPVGLAMVRFAKLLGASFVAHSGHHEARIAVAKKQGADLCVNSKKEDFVQSVRSAHPEKLDYFIDAVGRTAVLDQALSLVKDDGVIGVYGIGLEEDQPIRWNSGPYNFKIHSVQWPIAPKEAAIHGEVEELVLQKKILLSDFVTHKLPIDQFEKGFELVENREGLKVALYF